VTESAIESDQVNVLAVLALRSRSFVSEYVIDSLGCHFDSTRIDVSVPKLPVNASTLNMISVRGKTCDRWQDHGITA